MNWKNIRDGAGAILFIAVIGVVLWAIGLDPKWKFLTDFAAIGIMCGFTFLGLLIGAGLAHIAAKRGIEWDVDLHFSAIGGVLMFLIGLLAGILRYNLLLVIFFCTLEVAAFGYGIFKPKPMRHIVHQQPLILIFCLIIVSLYYLFLPIIPAYPRLNR